MMIDDKAAAVITDTFKNRWRTLMSVDDVIADTIAACEGLGIMDHTYFFYTSDHGFQLGQFNIIMDKRHVYDWDTRIHLLSRGPGIVAGSTFAFPATQVDLAPTFLALAKLDIPDFFDGRSMVPLLVTGAAADAAADDAAVDAAASRAEYAASWRQEVFIEYYFNQANVKCCDGCKDPTGTAAYPHRDTWCGDLDGPTNTHCWALYGCSKDCYPTESTANNYIALRSMPGSRFGNTLYAEYQTGDQSKKDVNFTTHVDAHEYYNATADPWMLNNSYPDADSALQADLHDALQKWFKCAGASCP
jgi:N-acetylglucosamine-6-sulfatase